MTAAARPIYEIRFRSRRVTRELDSLSQADYRRVSVAIQHLASEPRPAGTARLEDNIYRIRVGRYRVIYSVDDNQRLVEIGGIRRRSERTYRRVRDLFSR